MSSTFLAIIFTVLSLLLSCDPSQVDTSADGSKPIQEKYPYLFWQGSNTDNGELLEGRVESPDLKIIKSKLKQLDWSGEASSRPYFGICLDRDHRLRIELAAEKGKKSAMVATIRTPSAKSGDTTFYTYTRSRPLKDNGQVLKLLNSYLKKDKKLDSLAEWETTDGKLPRGTQP